MLPKLEGGIWVLTEHLDPEMVRCTSRPATWRFPEPAQPLSSRPALRGACCYRCFLLADVCLAVVWDRYCARHAVCAVLCFPNLILGPNSSCLHIFCQFLSFITSWFFCFPCRMRNTTEVSILGLWKNSLETPNLGYFIYCLLKHSYAFSVLLTD